MLHQITKSKTSRLISAAVIKWIKIYQFVKKEREQSYQNISIKAKSALDKLNKNSPSKPATVKKDSVFLNLWNETINSIPTAISIKYEAIVITNACWCPAIYLIKWHLSLTIQRRATNVLFGVSSSIAKGSIPHPWWMSHICVILHALEE